mmetsp:Transcript_43413/g.106590  ORF Transcript_43413/g.106590 Transcript_43413/m.106590 type:complete len:262 (+) Transcript_43413:148-933(+)
MHMPRFEARVGQCQLAHGNARREPNAVVAKQLTLVLRGDVDPRHVAVAHVGHVAAQRREAFAGWRWRCGERGEHVAAVRVGNVHCDLAEVAIDPLPGEHGRVGVRRRRPRAGDLRQRVDAAVRLGQSRRGLNERRHGVARAVPEMDAVRHEPRVDEALLCATVRHDVESPAGVDEERLRRAACRGGAHSDGVGKVDGVLLDEKLGERLDDRERVERALVQRLGEDVRVRHERAHRAREQRIAEARTRLVLGRAEHVRAVSQ